MNNIKKLALQYKVAIGFGILFSLNSLFTAILISFLNTDWSSLNGTSKFLLIVGILQNWTGTLLAFFNKTIARVEQGKFPIDTGDTQIMTKTSVEQTQIKTNEKTTANPNP